MARRRSALANSAANLALASVMLLAAICGAAPFASAANVDPFTGMVMGASSSASAAERASEVVLAQPGRQLQQACTDTCKALPKMAVCGTDGKSYDNACYPACTGAKIKYIGKCSSKPCLCAPLYAPVCGGGKTYINSCFAKCAGASSSKNGYCGSDCQCPSTKASVCALDGKTYDNWCKAACAGTVPYYSGACDTRIGTCKCATANDPVCVTTYIETKLPTGTIRTPISTTYASPCLAQCQAGAKTWAKGACKDDYQYDAPAGFNCGCSSTLKPVCGQLTVAGLNLTATLSNKCGADCLGYKTLYDGECKNECLCPFAAEPVCVGKKTYKSACLARCQGGATTWTKGSCTPCSKCPAAAFDTYVCGKDGMPFGNQCLAECVGAEVAYKGFCGAAGKRMA